MAGKNNPQNSETSLHKAKATSMETWKGVSVL